MHMEKIEIKWWEEDNHLSEDYDEGLEYSLFNKEHQQCTQAYYCKDFTQDAVHAFIHKKKNSIYGFNYSPSHPPLDLNNIRIILANCEDSTFLNKIPNVLDFLNQVEKLLRFKRTKAFLISNPTEKHKTTGMFAVVGSGRWQKSPVLLSMYSLLIRVGFRHKVGKDWRVTVKGIVNGKISQYQDNDRDYLKKAVPGIERLIALDPRQVFFKQHVNNYPANIDIYKLHHSSGICAFAEGTTKSIKKYWHRKELDEKYNELKTKSVIL